MRRQSRNGCYAGCLTVIIVAILIAVIFAMVIPSIRASFNEWGFALQKVDDQTTYATRKQVEDTCRAMIASYKADVLRYEQYKASDDPEQKNWGEQAKMRANSTAVKYNEYILKNSFVFENNIPSDIQQELVYIE